MARLLATAAVAASAACSTAATEVLVTLDSDVPITRGMTVSVSVRRGGTPADAGHVHTWLRGAADGGISLPASFAIVLAPGERDDDAVTLVVSADLAAFAGDPVVRIDRTATFAFVPGQSFSLRIFLTASCGVITTGCTTTAQPCTLSQLCEDMGMTCGEHGSCTPTAVSLLDAGVDVSPADIVAADVCAPNCRGRTCGVDPVCGRSCGACATGQICNGSGTCVAGVGCGDGICNHAETCASCPGDCPCGATQVCNAGTCCTPACGGSRCGPDGCGGSCPACPSGESCRSGNCAVVCGDHLCGPGENCSNCAADCGCAGGAVCVAGACCSRSCSGACGADGCGGFCGTCPTGQSCSATGCHVVCGDGICAPFMEGCASCPRDCPCAAGSICDTAGVCCTPSCPPSCGSDGCGGHCGACSTGLSCTATGCRAVCGDGMCAPVVEGCASCPSDCPCPVGDVCTAGACCHPSCPGSCGSDGCGHFCGACGTGLSCTSTGCRAVCGDGMCAPFVEGCASCPVDCPCPTGHTCTGGVCV